MLPLDQALAAFQQARLDLMVAVLEANEEGNALEQLVSLVTALRQQTDLLTKNAGEFRTRLRDGLTKKGWSPEQIAELFGED